MPSTSDTNRQVSTGIRMHAELACMLEATARKPGNAHRDRDLSGLTYLQLLASAAAIGPAFDHVADQSIGSIVYEAVAATRRAVDTNANLGIVLLLAPLAKAAALGSMRSSIETVLAATSVDDAARVYAAIRLARPGGLGSAAEQDVHAQPSVDLRSAMRLAADRDSIARQYSNGFSDVLGSGSRRLAACLQAGANLEAAIVATFLELLSKLPDSLIARKHGLEVASEASRRAADVACRINVANLASLPTASDLANLDEYLTCHRYNPGTTADLTTAVVFCALVDGTILPTMHFGGTHEWRNATELR